MIAVAVFDFDPEGLERMKRELLTYTIQRDTELRTFWFTEERSLTRLEAVIGGVHAALISLADGMGRELGRRIYARNPDCRIVFYGPDDPALRPLLGARPIGYHALSEGGGRLAGTLDAVIDELVTSSAFFRFRNRRRTLLIPTRTILYFQSELKTVRIFLTEGQTEAVTAKLSDVERGLTNDFIRIHQSFLVNGRHVRVLDRSGRTVVLSDGARLPLSDAKYDAAAARIEAMTSL